MLSLNLTTLLKPFKPSQCSMKKICLTEKCVLNLTSLQVTYLISYKILKPNLPYKQTFEIGPHGKSTSPALQLHTRRFDSQFPIFSNPILNSNFYIFADPGSTYVGVKYYVKQCRIVYQSHILPPAPQFGIRLQSAQADLSLNFSLIFKSNTKFEPLQ